VFTGLISHIGELTRVAQDPSGRELTVTVPWTDLAIGESVAIDGVCLTVVELTQGAFTAAAVTPTVNVTTVGGWRTGRMVNLERALRASDRLGGHIVQGHVDGVGEVTSVRHEGDAVLLDVTLWDGADALCVRKGSIAIDGVSLTVFAIAGGTVTVSLIDHTRRNTTLGDRRAGERVNVELDVIGKYVRQLVAPWGTGADVIQ
jgi:riboflavin synthase